jgi:hypothetical protein
MRSEERHDRRLFKISAIRPVTFRERCALHRAEVLRRARLGSPPRGDSRRHELLQQAVVLCHLECDCADDGEALGALRELAGWAGPVGAAARALTISLAVPSVAEERELAARQA